QELFRLLLAGLDAFGLYPGDERFNRFGHRIGSTCCGISPDGAWIGHVAARVSGSDPTERSADSGQHRAVWRICLHFPGTGHCG
ncbi:MAG TPA: hypothetical protein VMZ50_00550, partial [Phycisphaerae bacterium]|nr:hypothetical protein [Phycisphaerae bacterium]